MHVVVIIDINVLPDLISIDLLTEHIFGNLKDLLEYCLETVEGLFH